MTTPIRIECEIHFGRQGRDSRKVLKWGRKPAAPAPGRIPRVARLMALAIKCNRLIRGGVVANHAELARLRHVTRAPVALIMGLLALAPDIKRQSCSCPGPSGGGTRSSFTTSCRLPRRSTGRNSGNSGWNS